jgi:hypothetical protein
LAGALISITPVDGLFIAANFEKVTGLIKEGAYNAFTVGAGYTIAGIVPIRVQYAGKGSNAASEAYGAIEAAVGFTGLEGLVLDLGAQIGLGTDPIKLGLAATYAAGDFGLGAILKLQFVGDFGIAFYAEPTYQLGSEYSVGLPVRFGNGSLSSGLASNDLGIGLYGKRHLPGGYVQLGVAADIGFGGATRISIPLIFEHFL